MLNLKFLLEKKCAFAILYLENFSSANKRELQEITTSLKKERHSHKRIPDDRALAINQSARVRLHGVSALVQADRIYKP